MRFRQRYAFIQVVFNHTGRFRWLFLQIWIQDFLRAMMQYLKGMLTDRQTLLIWWYGEIIIVKSKMFPAYHSLDHHYSAETWLIRWKQQSCRGSEDIATNMLHTRSGAQSVLFFTLPSHIPDQGQHHLPRKYQARNRREIILLRGKWNK